MCEASGTRAGRQERRKQKRTVWHVRKQRLLHSSPGVPRPSRQPEKLLRCSSGWYSFAMTQAGMSVPEESVGVVGGSCASAVLVQSRACVRACVRSSVRSPECAASSSSCTRSRLGTPPALHTRQTRSRITAKHFPPDATDHIKLFFFFISLCVCALLNVIYRYFSMLL